MIGYFEKSGFEGTFSCGEKTLILFIKAVYRGDLKLLGCISAFPASDDLSTALRKLPVHGVPKESVTQCKQNSYSLEDLRFSKNFPNSSFFLPPMNFREFVLFVQEMVFAVFLLNSVSQATHTTGIVLIY